MPPPMVTIGVPTYNRAWSIPRVLSAIEGFDYPKKRIRLVFVDNNSTDGTQEIAREFKKKHLGEYESIHVVVKETNIAQARTICVQKAKGSDYILFVDSDIVPPPNSIKHLLDIFARYSNVGFAGFPPQRYPAPKVGEKAWFSKMPNKPYAVETIGHDCTMVKMKVYQLIGIYNPILGRDEDTELVWRAKKAGYAAILDPTIKVFHLRRQKESFLRSILNYGDFMFTKMAHYRFRLLLEYLHLKILQKWIFYTFFLLSILFLPFAIIFNEILMFMPFIVLFSSLFIFHFIRASGTMRVINPFFYAFGGLMLAAGMWIQLIRYMVKKLSGKAK